MNAVLRLLLLLLVSACATTGTTPYVDPPAPPEGTATLVIFREWGYRGSFVNCNFFVDGELVAGLGTHTYTFITVKTGRIGVSWAPDQDMRSLAQRMLGVEPMARSKPIEIYAQAGETYFFKHGATTTAIVPLPFVIVSTAKTEWGFVEEKAAREELKTYTFVKPIKDSIQ